ncbi:pre-peptidase C-terminal domain-containing protein [Pseudoalteromonas maricaloris]|uniref:Phosphohydrolase n=1 Tax=Pseudoalteromonas maricaloris TaxID=184924 RepID=A0A8I2GXY9_9GAMM|nr:pre-peptidase C-terminal domain-containing protein [Pseudoalteromonas maricaloris]NLR19768.1 phosphohydrolase [Pseudoalteromonas maricaloris]WOX27647.1 pre-peptidase C-terminal domain-containing protein [Pseudoalteromonas maricaloris]
MKYTQMATFVVAAGLSCSSFAASDYHRLVWDASPSTSATIGFTPTSGTNHIVKYGSTTDEQSWQSAAVSATYTFDGGLSSSFVKLTGLTPDSAVYYRVCDSQGCGQRLWFRTAPQTASGITAVAGGDTRTGWTTRRKGNELIAKIRPLFIMHGGDYTNANSVSEMREYLKDWQLTFSDDLIDGLAYKRIYPFVATHGNHEDDNYKTLCEVFGVDYDQDGACTAKDTYGAFNVAGLLRVYTLNSQFKNSGWSSYATAMNNWLKSDLQSQGNSATWRIAQYHKPMYPHYSGKSDNTILHTWWAQDFYNNAMNLVVESDTHINKLTYALTPTSNGFTATTQGGTVYVGEGSWGAPARSANAPKSWTIDLASIQQFKVLSVTNDKLTVRTAEFSSNATALSKAQRDADPLALPMNMTWWYAAEIGDELNLIKASNNLSVIETPIIEPPAAIELISGQTQANVTGAKSSQTLYYIDVPAGATQLKVETAGGSGDVDMYVRFNAEPTTQNYDCRPYKSGNNEVCTITPVQTGRYYVMLDGYESYSGVALTATVYTDTPPDQGNSQQWLDQSASKGQWQYYTFDVAQGTQSLQVKASGGTGDADLYLRFGQQPNSNTYECRPYENGNNETCTITNPNAGTWHIGLYGYAAFSGLTLQAESQ